MGNIVLSLVVNLTMAALLLVTIFYCRKLNAKIRVLQDSRSELAKIIREFDESTQRATDSIAEIHQATQRLSDNIQHKIDKANFLATDLEFMIERGNKMSGGGAATAPASSPARPSRTPLGASPRAEMEKVHSLNITSDNAASASPPPARAARQRSRAEQELMNVLKTKEESGR